MYLALTIRKSRLKPKVTVGVIGVVVRDQADREVFTALGAKEPNEPPMENSVGPFDFQADGFMLEAVAPSAFT